MPHLSLYAVGGVEDRSSLRLPWRLLATRFARTRVIGERQVLMVAIKGQLYLLPEPGPAKFENINQDGLHDAPEDFE